ncbi:MAG: hypothetical protein ACRDUY_08190 [Nitriliruptorales bacterium]
MTATDLTGTLNLKRCPQCEETKPLSEFRRDSGKRSGHQSWCADCKGAYDRDTYAATLRTIRVPVELHRRLRREAKRNGMGVGQLVLSVLSHALNNQCQRDGCVRPVYDRGFCARDLKRLTGRAA